MSANISRMRIRKMKSVRRLEGNNYHDRRAETRAVYERALGKKVEFRQVLRCLCASCAYAFVAEST